ncbi:LLM class flavin-dependent oxidoreductase [Streptomyces flaveolus]|uniref:LLM class flavin-dependent oxidoreductase n=1 Tax=Streptomyces flaveolus TaxID=67297 RepID=UPI00341A5299
MNATPFDIGVNSFGEVATDDGRVLDDAETVRLLVEEAALAEASGLDVFSVGEHYRAGHGDSATPVLLAAMATATERIRLGTSVTVLSTNDPVRLYQEFSTLDAGPAAGRSWSWGARPPRSPSRCSATTSPTTSSSSRRSWSCSCGCGVRRR